MYYDPYLDCDWTEAQSNPEISHILWLSDEELNTRKTQVKQKIEKHGRTTQRDSRRTETTPQAA